MKFRSYSGFIFTALFGAALGALGGYLEMRQLLYATWHWAVYGLAAGIAITLFAIIVNEG